MASRYSVDQSCSVAGLTRVSACCAAASPRTSQPASSSAATSAASTPLGAALSTSSVSVAPHTPVRRILALTTMRLRHLQVGAAVDVGVADAFQVREHRHARLLLHARHQALAAARHDHVDGAVEALQHQPHGLAVGGGHELDGSLGQARLAQAARQAHLDGAAGMMALRAAAQDRGVAGLEAQRAGVGRHVGPALVDDADHAQRHAHALDSEAIGARPLGDHGADRIGQRGDLLEPLGHGLDALGVEHQPVEERCRPLGLAGGGQVARVGLDDGGGLGAQLARRRQQRRVLGLGRGERQRARRLARLAAERAHCLADVLQRLRRFRLVVRRHALLSTMSSRCTSSVRPAWPRMAAISPLRLPMIRAASARA